MEQFFKLKERGTDVRTEAMAGLTTFMTMAYILAVNPGILSAAGMDAGAVFTATALASALGTLCMAVLGVLVNKFIMLPFYMGAYHMSMDGILKYANVGGVDSEWKLLLLVTAPFNLLKGAVLSVITGFIYKPLSPILHAKIK